MKKVFVKGFVLGAMFFGSAVSLATVGYEALTATFPILINGQFWESEKPVVVIEGSTYLPLKAIGEVLGVNVSWNSDLRQVEIGENQVQNFENQPVIESYSRKNPAPVGIPQTIKVSDYSKEYTATVEVKDVIRGRKAWSKIEDANMFNDEARDGYEYILAKINVSIDSVKDDKAISVSEYNFDCFSTDNVKYDRPSVVEPEPELSTSLYEGGKTTGYVAFEVLETDENPKIVFEQNYDGTGGIWFSLAK